MAGESVLSTEAQKLGFPLLFAEGMPVPSTNMLDLDVLQLAANDFERQEILKGMVRGFTEASNAANTRFSELLKEWGQKYPKGTQPPRAAEIFMQGEMTAFVEFISRAGECRTATYWLLARLEDPELTGNPGEQASNYVRAGK